MLLTPVSTTYPGALVHLEGVALWQLADFKSWAIVATQTIRELRKTYLQAGDLAWRAEAASILKYRGMDIISLQTDLKSKPAKKILVERSVN